MKTLLLVLVIQVLRGVQSSKDESGAGSTGSKVMAYRLARDERDAAKSTRQKDVSGDQLSRKEREAAESTRPEGEAKENVTSIRVDDSDDDDDRHIDYFIDQKIAEALDEVHVKVEKWKGKVETLEDQIATMKGEMLTCVTGRIHHTIFRHNYPTQAKVEFPKAFTEPPQVLLSLDKLRTYGHKHSTSWGAYIPIYYNLYKSDLTKSGFNANMVVWMPARPNVTKPNVEMKFSWLACGNMQPRMY